jgi:hypothetical protein
MNFKLIFLILVLPFCSLAQTAKIGLLNSNSFGVNFHTKGFSDHSGINDLNNFNTDNLYFKVAVSGFYHEKAGIELAYLGNITTKQNYREFKSMIESRYSPSDYYIHYSKLTNDHKTSLSTAFFMAGPTARINYKKISFIPKLLFGGGSFLLDTVHVFLKKRNGNESISETYTPDNSTNRVFNINGGINIVYIFYRRLGLNLELNYYWCRVNSLNYTITTSDIMAGTESKSYAGYKQSLRTFTVGLGISYYFKIGKTWKDG